MWMSWVSEIKTGSLSAKAVSAKTVVERRGHNLSQNIFRAVDGERMGNAACGICVGPVLCVLGLVLVSVTTGSFSRSRCSCSERNHYRATLGVRRLVGTSGARSRSSRSLSSEQLPSWRATATRRSQILDINGRTVGGADNPDCLPYDYAVLYFNKLECCQ